MHSLVSTFVAAALALSIANDTSGPEASTAQAMKGLVRLLWWLNWMLGNAGVLVDSLKVVQGAQSSPSSRNLYLLMYLELAEVTFAFVLVT